MANIKSIKGQPLVLPKYKSVSAAEYAISPFNKRILGKRFLVEIQEGEEGGHTLIDWILMDAVQNVNGDCGDFSNSSMDVKIFGAPSWNKNAARTLEESLIEANQEWIDDKENDT